MYASMPFVWLTFVFSFSVLRFVHVHLVSFTIAHSVRSTALKTISTAMLWQNH